MKIKLALVNLHRDGKEQCLPVDLKKVIVMSDPQVAIGGSGKYYVNVCYEVKVSLWQRFLNLFSRSNNAKNSTA